VSYIPVQKIKPQNAAWVDVFVTYRDDREKGADFSPKNANAKLVQQRYCDMKKLMNVERIIMPRPTHGSQIYANNPLTDEFQAPFCDKRQNADMIYIDAVNVAGAFAPADCAVVVIMDKAKRAIGILHLGWRGLVKKNIEIYFNKFMPEPDECQVYVALFASQNFHLRPDEVVEFKNLDERLFTERVGENGLFDMKKLLTEQLNHVGVSSNRIEFHPDNTLTSDKYFSYSGGDEFARFLVAAKIVGDKFADISQSMEGEND